MSRKAKLLWLIWMLAGLAILSYPCVSNYLNQLNSSWAISQAQEALEEAEPERVRLQRQLAQQYNSALLEGREPDGYEKILDFGDGIMGYVQIPAIGIKLPVYHGTEETVLQKGAGHLPQSAFPIGGIGNHAVITGHTGLPNAKLFTDLTQLKEGDIFYIHILEQILAYQVDAIQIVLPSETKALQPNDTRDYCTLVTCTPYGINSHRLLVRGRRIERTEEPEEVPEMLQETKEPVPIGVVLTAVAAVILIVCILWTVFARKKE